MKTTTVGNLIAALENYDPEQPVMLNVAEIYDNVRIGDEKR